MAESPSSTSEKPPIENLGLGLLITDLTLLDPINPATQISEVQHTESSANDPVGNRDSPTEVMPEAVDSIAVLDEDVELRNAIERDLCQLTIQQAEIEGARDRSEAVDGDEGNDLGTVRKSDEDEEDTEGKDSASVEDENENDNEGGDEDNHGTIKFGDGVNKLERFNQTNNGRRSNYPMRPDAEDCTFYMKFGSCKFGLNCKFNHPPRRKNQGVKERANHREENSERAGQTECKYYLTPGGCKYGKDCKYFHGSDRNSTPQIPEFNFLGLPIRMGEKECPRNRKTKEESKETNQQKSPSSTKIKHGRVLRVISLKYARTLAKAFYCMATRDVRLDGRSSAPYSSPSISACSYGYGNRPRKYGETAVETATSSSCFHIDSRLSSISFFLISSSWNFAKHSSKSD